MENFQQQRLMQSNFTVVANDTVQETAKKLHNKLYEIDKVMFEIDTNIIKRINGMMYGKSPAERDFQVFSVIGILLIFALSLLHSFLRFKKLKNNQWKLPKVSYSDPLTFQFKDLNYSLLPQGASQPARERTSPIHHGLRFPYQRGLLLLLSIGPPPRSPSRIRNAVHQLQISKRNEDQSSESIHNLVYSFDVFIPFD